MKIDPYNISGKNRTMIIASRNIWYMRIFAGVPRGGASKDSGVVEDGTFYRFNCYRPICSEPLD